MGIVRPFSVRFAGTRISENRMAYDGLKFVQI